MCCSVCGNSTRESLDDPTCTGVPGFRTFSSVGSFSLNRQIKEFACDFKSDFRPFFTGPFVDLKSSLVNFKGGRMLGTEFRKVLFFVGVN